MQGWECGVTVHKIKTQNIEIGCIWKQRLARDLWKIERMENYVTIVYMSSCVRVPESWSLMSGSLWNKGSDVN